MTIPNSNDADSRVIDVKDKFGGPLPPGASTTPPPGRVPPPPPPGPKPDLAKLLHEYVAACKACEATTTKEAREVALAEVIRTYEAAKAAGHDGARFEPTPLPEVDPFQRIIHKVQQLELDTNQTTSMVRLLNVTGGLGGLKHRPDVWPKFEEMLDNLIVENEVEWPEPDNVFKNLAAPAFDGSELPPELAEFPLLDAKQTGFDPGIGLNAALAVASMAIGDHIKICANSSTEWFEEARLWIEIIAPPGIGKTPGQKPLLKPLWAIHKRLYEEWKGKHDEWAKLPKKDRGPAPVLDRVILTDVTMARLSDVLKDNPRGIALVVDEFSSWLGALDMQASAGAGGHDRGEALMLFQGGPHQIERVARGSIFVANWSAGILTGSTPAQMEKYSKHLPEDGLIQRFLVYLARDKFTPEPATGEHEKQLEEARTRYSQMIEKLWALEPITRKGVVQMSQEARAHFATWQASVDEHVQAYRDLVPPLAGHVAKYPTIALRIALVFHCVQAVSKAPPPNGLHDVAAQPLSLATIAKATEFLAASLTHAKSMYMELSGSGGPIGISREVANYILVHKAPDNVLARRDVLHHVHGFKKADERARGEAMRFLEDMGWIRATDGGQRRATGPTRYLVNPKIAKRFAAEAEREATRREVVRDLIAASVKARREGA